jgi:hypothetical protein
MTDREFDCPRCGHCCPQPNQEPDAYGYAKRLALAIWEQHYKDVAPQWKPFDDLMGVLTQIDNMTARLTTPPAAQPFWDLFDETQRLRAELKFNTTPPQQWVKLTDEEIKSLPSWWPSYEDAPALVQLVKDIEAKLREKNGGSHT